MPPRLKLAVRVGLVFIALSLAFVAARMGQQALRYFSPLIELAGTVASAELTAAIPMARGDPRARVLIQSVPTRLQVVLREIAGVRFEVALRGDPEQPAPRLKPGETVTLVLPTRWREMEVGDRVLAIGLKRGAELLVDPADYPYTAEFRTAFAAVGALVGAVVCLLAVWRLGRM